MAVIKANNDPTPPLPEGETSRQKESNREGREGCVCPGLMAGDQGEEGRLGSLQDGTGSKGSQGGPPWL